MKLMFISDIHGSAYYLEKALAVYQQVKPDKLVILGDILYHGPRNPLPEGYDCKAVIAMLNPLKDQIIAVRGNCDSEVDQMVLDFPMRADYIMLQDEKHRFFLTHGHLYDKDHLPPLCKGDILAYGHYHVPMAEKLGDIYVINPSSISLPKAATNSYGIYEEDTFTVYDFERNIITSITFE